MKLVPQGKNMIEKTIIDIGVYGFSEDEFFGRLVEAGTDIFVDIRQRRGVRGSKYAFVNSNRLQAKLAELGINYLYIKDLAPTKEIRELQKKHDLEVGIEKRNRIELGEIFVEEYKNKILSNYDFTDFKKAFGNDFFRPCFFCVEAHPSACHRSLVCSKLSTDIPLFSIQK